MPTSVRPGSTTCSPCPGRTSRSSRAACAARVAARALALRRTDRGDRGDRRLRPRGRLAAVGRAGGRRGRARLARVAGIAAERPVVLPAPRRGGAAGLEPVQAARCRLPALVRGRGCDLRRRAAARATLEGYPVPRPLARWSRSPAACGLATAPILLISSGPSRSTRFRQRARGAGRRAAARARARHGDRGSGRAASRPCSPGPTAGWRHISPGAPASSAGCRRGRFRSGCGRVAAVVSACVLVARRGRPRGRRRGDRSRRARRGGWRVHGAPPPPPPHGLRITFLDVGQGDGALLQVPGGAVLVDEGPPEAEIASQLQRLGVTSSVARRPHASPAGPHRRCGHVLRSCASTPCSIRRLPTRARTSVRPVPQRGSAASDHRRARGGGVPHRRAPAPRRLARRAGDARRRPEQPRRRPPRLVRRDRRAAHRRRRVRRHRPPQLPPVEILKVAHHGSADAGLGAC